MSDTGGEITGGTLSPTIRPGRASVRTTYQLCAGVAPRDGETVDATRLEAIRTALTWVRGKLPADLPAGALDGASFELDEAGNRVVAVAVPDEGIWALRLEQPDAPLAGSDAVPGRSWIHDLAFRLSEGALHFGVRIQCASHAYATAPIVPLRPGVVRELTARFTLTKARPLDGQPWHLRAFEDLPEFEAFLLDPQRAMPVVLLTQPDPARHAEPVAPFLLDPDRLARKLIGLGYVATMPHKLGFHWTDLVGKPWSAFLGAVRTYMPGMDYERDTPLSHPLAFADRVLGWRYRDLDGEHEGIEAFERFLAGRALEYSATKPVDWKRCVFAPDARAMRAALARQQTTNAEELQALYEDEVRGLREQLTAVQYDVETAIQLAGQAERERDQAQAEAAKLRAHNEALRVALEQQDAYTDTAEDTMPGSYEAIPDWVDEHLAGRLVLHPRAVRALKAAEYEDVELVARALLALATEWRRMMLGHSGADGPWKQRCDELHLGYGRSIRDSRVGEQGDAYHVDWPPRGNQRHLLEWHLTKGTSHDPRHCLRI